MNMIPFMIPIKNSWGKCKIKSEGSSHCVHTHSSATFLRYLQLNAASPRFVTLASSVAIFQILGSASFLYVLFFMQKHTCARHLSGFLKAHNIELHRSLVAWSHFTVVPNKLHHAWSEHKKQHACISYRRNYCMIFIRLYYGSSALLFFFLCFSVVLSFTFLDSSCKC